MGVVGYRSLRGLRGLEGLLAPRLYLELYIFYFSNLLKCKIAPYTPKTPNGLHPGQRVKSTPIPASLPEKGSAVGPQSRPANLDLAGPQSRNLNQSAANGLLRRWYTVPKRLSKRWNRFNTAPRDQHPLGATLSFTGGPLRPRIPDRSLWTILAILLMKGKAMTDDGIAKTPEEMAAKVAADQKTDMSGHTPKRNVSEGGFGNAYTGPTKYTGPGGLPMRSLHRGHR